MTTDADLLESTIQSVIERGRQIITSQFKLRTEEQTIISLITGHTADFSRPRTAGARAEL